MEKLRIVIVGGGAAGFFAAINCAEIYPQHEITILEKTRQTLAKVRISGGGRCNVTHSCFDPSQLIRFYPRGNRELRGPFSQFQPKDTIAWFEKRGVTLKTEEDGRMFPVTDNSETIIGCLQSSARQAKVELKLESHLSEIKKKDAGFELKFINGTTLECDRVLLATGSTPAIYSITESLGHTTVPLVPSLFTFNVPDSPLVELAGISLEHAQVKIPQISLEQAGPLLITHWGFSGPAILKASAWGARELFNLKYKTEFFINWLPNLSEEDLKQILEKMKVSQGARQIGSESPFSLPKQLWKKLLQLAEIDPETRWSILSKKQMQTLILVLRASKFNLDGKTTYKQEFVTCGGVDLQEVDFKTMQSKRCPGLFFAGEILNIDGVTGGFNFQNAWTTGWIAAHAIGKA